jgi:hypothetical protein
MTSLDQTLSPSAPDAEEPHAPSSRKVDDRQGALTPNPAATAADRLQLLSRQLRGAEDIEQLRLLADIIDEATASLNNAVRSAREAGKSWQAIADAVKTTRQAANARWRKLVAEPDEESAPETEATTRKASAAITKTTKKSGTCLWPFRHFTIKAMLALSIKRKR